MIDHVSLGTRRYAEAVAFYSRVLAGREAVAAAHATALGASAQDIFSPRLRPDISETYFGAMFHDLDGHRIEVLTNAA
jgi:catechol 2,3-dioxygenase-like lactoylglutathione lyase family enzyme